MVLVKTFLETVNKSSKKNIIKFGRSSAAFKIVSLQGDYLFLVY